MGSDLGSWTRFFKILEYVCMLVEYYNKEGENNYSGKGRHLAGSSLPTQNPNPPSSSLKIPRGFQVFRAIVLSPAQRLA